MLQKWITGFSTLLCFLSLASDVSLTPRGKEEDISAVQRRFLLADSGVANVSLEQFASCFLTCTPGYEKLAEACCYSGIGVVCSNLPWDMLKPILGKCPGLSVNPLPTAWVSLEQFAACSLDCVVGYEKLTAACCQTGLDVVCSNLPWSLLKLYLGTCNNASVTTSKTTPTQLTSHSTSHSTISQQITSQMTTSTTTPQPYWSPWESWNCEHLEGSCFQKRSRNCSTGTVEDCSKILGGTSYNIEFCTIFSCPEYFLSTAPATIPTTTQQVPCEDDPNSVGCQDQVLLTEVCRIKETAWSLCRKSCGLCDKCWDYLNCTSKGAKDLFCSNDNYAVQYCRKSCGKCDHTPVDVLVNMCGDPVANEDICELLQTETCICNDPDIRSLCENYCNNKCLKHPFKGSDCAPARRRRRDAIFKELILI